MSEQRINEWKLRLEVSLPPQKDVINRNIAITKKYARLYKNSPQQFKWAGMAAFASYHIGMSLIPYKWINLEIIDLEHAIADENFKNSIQLIRLLNNKIFDDIAWIHLVYADTEKGGMKELKLLLQNHEHYDYIYKAFEKIDAGTELLKNVSTKKKGEHLIWQGNQEVLWHEQSQVVQPIFDKMSTAFSRAMTLCATFDYKVSHTKTDWRTHSSFIFFMFTKGFNLVKDSSFMPLVTKLEHRWFWIENSLLDIWKKTDANDRSLISKIDKIIDL